MINILTTLHPSSVHPLQKTPRQLIMLLHILEPDTVEATPLAQTLTQSKPKSVCTYRKPLSRKPNIHQSQSAVSALAHLPLPRKQDPESPSGNSQPPSQSDPVFALPLSTVYKTQSSPKSLGKSILLLVGPPHYPNP